jgi:cytochrome c-type biogenesis protein CcmH
MKKSILFALLAIAIFGSLASAQSPDAQQLYTKLYCPLCGGVRLDVCELKVCADMKQVINERLAAGESEQQIIAYFRQQYGDQVLGYPPAEGINLLPWLIPFVLMVLAALVLWQMALRWTRRAAPARVPAGPLIPGDIVARIERELDE